MFFFLVRLILRRLSGKHFRVAKFKFVIRHGKITFGKLKMRITRSKSKRFSASKGYFSFKFHKKVYYMRFRSTGMKVLTMHHHKIVKTFVRIRRRTTHKRLIMKIRKGKSFVDFVF